MTHAERCKESVACYASVLAQTIREGRMNMGAFEGLIETFMDTPAYSGLNKSELMELAKSFIGGSDVR